MARRKRQPHRRPQLGRFANPYLKLPPLSAGKHPCRVCGKEPPGRRKTFCSEQCVHEWKMETRTSYRRRLVYRRDRGVCACCGLDTKTVSLRRARAEWELPLSRTSLWDMDHIMPLKLHGTNAMENLQTLCYPCHQDKTQDQDQPAIREARKQRIRHRRREESKAIRRRR